MIQNKVTRREFIEKSGIMAVCSLTFGELLLSCGKKESPTQVPTDNTYTIDLSNTTNQVLNSVGGALKFSVPGQSKPVIVIRKAENEVIALSSQCTHAGNEVNLPDGSTITCPVHGSQFDLSGNVVTGPATSPLSVIQSKLENGKIILTL